MEKRNRRHWTEEEIEFLKQNRADHTREWLAEHLGRDMSGIKAKLRNERILKYKIRVLRDRDKVAPEGYKHCRTCGRLLPLTEFHLSSGSKDGRQSSCRPCAIKNAVKWNRDHSEAFSKNRRTYLLRKRYGLSREQYDALMVAQGGRCPICSAPLTTQGTHIDHDHATGAVRGLLHGRCNTAIGMLGDSVDNLRRAVSYLSG